MHVFCGERIESLIVYGIDRNELALQVGCELGDLDTVFFGGSGNFLAVANACGGFLEVDEPAVPCGNLHALVTEARGPAADGVECVERRRVACELGEKDCRSLDRFHADLSFCLLNASQAFAHSSRRNLPPNW